MILSHAGALFIQGYEDCKLVAYLDSHVPPIWTIGWGHTGPDVHEGLVWSQVCADTMFTDYDVDYAEHAVNTLVLVPLTQNQFDALVSLVYNIGAEAFRTSTMLRFLNTHDYMEASKEFLRWDHSGGLVSNGLLKRRKAEMQVFDADATLVVPKPLAAPTVPVEHPYSMWASFLRLLTTILYAITGKKGPPT